MSSKKQRREVAQRKAKKKRQTLLLMCAAGLAVVITAVVVYTLTRPDSRVFAVSSGQTVVLYENGRFVANLFHDANISGTFTEEENDESGRVTTISFTHGGNTVLTQIEDDVLTLPPSWRATCRIHIHDTEFQLVR